MSIIRTIYFQDYAKWNGIILHWHKLHKTGADSLSQIHDKEKINGKILKTILMVFLRNSRVDLDLQFVGLNHYDGVYGNIEIPYKENKSLINTDIVLFRPSFRPLSTHKFNP